MRLLYVVLVLVASSCGSDSRTPQHDEVLYKPSEYHIGQHLASIEQAEIFANYLRSQDRSYFVSPDEPDVVYWAPKNDLEQNEVLRLAFGVPDNQQQSIFESEEAMKDFALTLAKRGIEHHSGYVEGHFVVLWFADDQAVIQDLKSSYETIEY